MAESQKEATSVAGSKKKSSSLDEDFGKDFLSSWKPAKVGKDMDFDVETVQQNGKKSFNFDKLEDFEFGGDFDKLSSFKMDMSDLDFSSPITKTGNTNEKTGKEFALGKQELRKDKFSFTFDFNELDNFDLGSKLLKGDKKTNSCEYDTWSDNSVKHDKHLDSKSNSIRSIDALKSDETMIIPNTESMATSRPAHLGEADLVNTVGPPTSSDLRHHDVSSEAHTSVGKQIFTKEDKKDEICNTENEEQADGTCPTKISAEKAAQNFAFLSVSGDGSVQGILPQGRTDIVSGDSVKVTSSMEQDNGIRSIDSSQSRSSSPTNSLGSRQLMPKDKTKSPNIRGEFHKYDVSPNEVTRENTSQSELIRIHKDVEKASLTNDGEKKDSSLKLLLSPLHSSRFFNAMSNKEKGTSSSQLKPLNTSEGSSSQQTPAVMSKQLSGFQSKKVATMNSHLARDANQNNKQIENQKGGILKLKDKTVKKGVSFVQGSARISDKDSDISRFQLQPANLSTPTAASSAFQSVAANLVAGHASVKSTKIDSFAGQGISLKDDREHDDSSLTSLRIKNVDCGTQNPTMHKEMKLVRFAERNLGFPLNTAPELANSASTVKFSPPNLPLKRKTLEESMTDLKNLNPLKRVTDPSTERRKSLEGSPRFDRGIVPGTENPETSDANVCVDNLISSNNVCEAGRMKEWEVPVLIENDGNVEKAEACAKEVDDICHMLKKKNDEAKELLVRAVVNNNRLLMLNHPMLDEKNIHALERFAASLRSKEYW